MWNRTAGLLLLLLAGLATAQERFYPVVGPDGRVRMIKGEAEAGAGGAAAKVAPASGGGTAKAGAARAPEPAGSQSAAGQDAPAQVAAPATAGAATAAAEEGAVAAPAPYDSDSYTDVEDIEGTTEEAGRPDRFYVIPDGSGRHITRSRGEDEPSAREPVVVAAPEQVFEALPLRLRVDDEISEADRPAGVPACLPAADLAAVQTAGIGTPVAVVVNRASHAFMGPGKVAAIIRLGESGLRTLVSRSYAAKDRHPAFLDPELFFLDAKGCMLRRVSGLYERRYGPTPRRHSMLRGELLVHGDEEYVLVVAATGGRRAVADSPFPVSSNGQLSFSIKK